MIENKYVCRTYQALENLFENCQEIQQSVQSKRLKSIDLLAYAKEFCTIRMASSRRSGHTMAIAKFICEHALDFAIICYNLNTAKILKNHVIEYSDENLMETDNKNHFMSFSSFDNQIRGMDIDAIICDTASLLNHEIIKRIYDNGLACMSNKQQMYFIFVG